MQYTLQYVKATCVTDFQHNLQRKKWRAPYLQLQKRQEQMKKSLEQQQKEMEEKWKAFEKEKQTWEESTGYSNSLENVKE